VHQRDRRSPRAYPRPKASATCIGSHRPRTRRPGVRVRGLPGPLQEQAPAHRL
jgi:hypothetical protein